MAAKTVLQKCTPDRRAALRVVSMNAFRDSKRQAAAAADQVRLVAVCQDLLDRAKHGTLQGLVFVTDDANDGRMVGRVGYGPERALAAASQAAHRFARWLSQVQGVDGE